MARRGHTLKAIIAARPVGSIGGAFLYSLGSPLSLCNGRISRTVARREAFRRESPPFFGDTAGGQTSGRLALVTLRLLSEHRFGKVGKRRQEHESARFANRRVR